MEGKQIPLLKALFEKTESTSHVAASEAIILLLRALGSSQTVYFSPCFWKQKQLFSLNIQILYLHKLNEFTVKPLIQTVWN